MPSIPRSTRFVAAIAVAALAVSACGSDEADTPEPTVEEVTATDYAFSGIPKTVAAGTRFTLKNSSTKELHEFVAIKLPDSEKREVADLLKLPESELEAIVAGEPAAVLLTPPGGEQIAAVGDGTITEPGRYAIVCFIPVGADPAAYMAAAQAGGDGPPEIPNAGPPHITQGMFAELVVK